MGHFTRAKNVALVFAINKLTDIAGYTRNLFNSKLRHSEQREESKLAIILAKLTGFFAVLRMTG